MTAEGQKVRTLVAPDAAAKSTWLQELTQLHDEEAAHKVGPTSLKRLAPPPLPEEVTPPVQRDTADMRVPGVLRDAPTCSVGARAGVRHGGRRSVSAGGERCHNSARGRRRTTRRQGLLAVAVAGGGGAGGDAAARGHAPRR